jgi:hypothetical protein
MSSAPRSKVTVFGATTVDGVWGDCTNPATNLAA